MNPLFRKIASPDIDQLFAVRISVIENPLSLGELAGMGITPESVRRSLGVSLEGYLCEIDNRVVGFSMADLSEGELSVIAVLPQYEGRGIGRQLLELTEKILWRSGYSSITLWTSVNRNTRALGLYQSTGWVESEVKERKLFMKKSRPNHALESE